MRTGFERHVGRRAGEVQLLVGSVDAEPNQPGRRAQEPARIGRRRLADTAGDWAIICSRACPDDFCLYDAASFARMLAELQKLGRWQACQ